MILEAHLKQVMEILEKRAAAGNDDPGARHRHQHLLGRLRALQGRCPEAETLLSGALEKLRRPSGLVTKRHAYRHAEAICREAGRTELADAHAEALVELEEWLKPALSEASAPAGSSGP